MATTVTTSTASYATAGGRHTGVTSGGTDWVMLYNLASTRLEFWYSTDNGATWTEATSLRFTVDADEVTSTEFYVGDDDRACFSHAGTGGGGVYYTATLTTSATWTTLLDSALNYGSDAQARCRVFHYGTIGANNSYAVVFMSNRSGTLAWQAYFRKVSDDSAAGSASDTIDASALAGWFDFDFQHTGDGITAATAPNMFVVYRDSDGSAEFRRLVHNASSWTMSTVRSIDTQAGVATDAMCGVFDGSRFVMAFIDNDSDTTVKWYERDAADTTTTSRTPTALSDGAITALSLSFDGESDARLYAVGTTSDDVKRCTYDRSAGTFGSWDTIEATTAVAGSVSVQAGYQGDGLNVVWSSGSGSPYTVTFERDTFNTAPSAPTWLTPSTGSAQDAGSTLAVTWQFNDDDAGDTQSAYALKRVISAVTTYYNAGAGTWDGTEVKNTSTTEGVTLPATWGSDGDAVALYTKTWDAADVEGVYGSALNLTGSTPVTPVITAPATNATVSGPTPTITWTATEQTARRIRWLTSADAVLYDSGKVTTTTKSLTSPYSLANGLVDVKLEVRVWNDDDLEGPVDTNTGIDVTFTAPMTPTYVVTADATSGYISVAITDPTPTGSPTPPDVTTHDVYVRVAAGGRPDGERPVGGDGIRIATGVATNTTFYDYAAGSGIDYEYRTEAQTATGATAFGAWT